MATLLQNGVGSDGNAAASLQQERNESYLSYLHQRQVHYATERRWNERPFWKGNARRNAGDIARIRLNQIGEY
ncbi:hypothetical protein ACU4GH_21610 [Bradyrhizobium betae]